MTTAHEKQIAHYESTTSKLLKDKELFESQCITLRKELEEEQQAQQKR